MIRIVALLGERAVRLQGRMNSLQQTHEIRLRGLSGGGVAAGGVRVDDSKRLAGTPGGSA
jgi:hypothetical protein